jgi:hypothetical protein
MNRNQNPLINNGQQVLPTGIHSARTNWHDFSTVRSFSPQQSAALVGRASSTSAGDSPCGGYLFSASFEIMG